MADRKNDSPVIWTDGITGINPKDIQTVNTVAPILLEEISKAGLTDRDVDRADAFMPGSEGIIVFGVRTKAAPSTATIDPFFDRVALAISSLQLEVWREDPGHHRIEIIAMREGLTPAIGTENGRRKFGDRAQVMAQIKIPRSSS